MCIHTGKEFIRKRIQTLCTKYDLDPKDLENHFKFYGNFKTELDKMKFEGTFT